MTLKCAHCGGDLGQRDGFCALCGVIVCRCPECNATLSAGDTACPGCGAPVDPTALYDPFTPVTDGGDSAWDDLVERLRRATQGEFEIGRELGRGGMAAVFLAHELALDRKVAIKVMSPGLLLGDGMVERFRHEAITIAHLHHPNIVSVYAVRQAEGLHFFVMQYVRGRSLEQVIRQAGRLPLPMVRSVLHQVGSALSYAHRRRIIHRDIKPGNILIDGDGNAVVTDFGIAKAAEAPSRTMTGALVGTPAYMSPEQCRGTEVSGASDQYALGAVAYEMLTGAPPFGGSTFTVLQAHVERTPRPLREHLAECPPEVEATVLRMLAKDPAARWPRIADAMACLGAQPLADDDPLRLELSQLATGGESSSSAPARSSAPPTPALVTGRESTAAVGGVAILPPPPDIEVGDTFMLVALVRGPNGTRLPPGTVTWSTDAPEVLKLDGGGGTAIAVGPGPALLTATCRGVRAVLGVEVAPPRADDITIEPPEHGVRAGDEIHLEATARDKRGRLITRAVTWQSADPGTATVTPTGVLLAQAPGLARISAVLDSVRSNIVVPILPPRVAALHVGDHPPAVAGGTLSLTATPVDRWGSPLVDRTVLWSSSDVRVAVVTAGGVVHTLRQGSVVLTASCEGISESVKLNVGPAAAAVPATAEAPPPTPAPAVHRRLRRHRPRRVLVGSVGTGLVAGLAWLFGRPDQSTVSAALPGPVVEEPSLAPEPGVASVVIRGRPRRALRPGGAVQLTAELRAPDGSPALGAGVTWAAADSTVLRVDPATGWVRALRPGQTHVVASSGRGRDSTPIAVRLPDVRAPAVGSVQVTRVEPLRVGALATLTAVVLDAGGAALPDAPVVWRSSDPSVAVVDSATGQVNAVAPGTTHVTAASGGQSATAEVTVLPPPVVDVIVLGARPLVVGETLTLVAVPVDAEGRELHGREVAWTSSDSSVLAVDLTSGLGDARSPGLAVITATAEGRSGGVSVNVSELRRDPAAAGPSREAGAERWMIAGVEECYFALRSKDMTRVTGMYRPVTRLDNDNLKKLRRILRTRELSAFVGERVDGERRVRGDTASMDFSFRMTWKDSFGGRIGSEPVLRAEFARRDGRWALSSCRIVGTPDL